LTWAEYNADQVWTAEDPPNESRWVEYTYTPDMLNRQSLNDAGSITNYGVNPLNQYTSLDGQPPGYDGNFNLTAFEGMQAEYDAQNRLLSATKNGVTVQFTYDGLGRCVRRSVNGAPTRFIYDDWKPILEFDGAGAHKAWNVYGTGPDEILMRSINWYDHLWYQNDPHGNVFTILDDSGSWVEKYTYDAFGKPTITEWHQWYGTERGGSWVGNRFMFQGREWIPELGIYDYRHRMYLPKLGRFLQTDPLGLQTEGVKLTAGQKSLFSPGGTAPEAFSSSEMNLYRYCGDDPVNKMDPNGTLAWFIAIPLWMGADWAYDKYAAEHVNNFVDRNFSQETASNLRTAGTAIDAARSLKNPVKLASQAKHLAPRRSIKDVDAVNDWNRHLGDGKQSGINPHTGKPDPDRIFTTKPDGSSRAVRMGDHETRNPKDQHYHLEKRDASGKLEEPDESVHVLPTRRQ
jgi:RHS repeat-associated protein